MIFASGGVLFELYWRARKGRRIGIAFSFLVFRQRSCLLRLRTTAAAEMSTTASPVVVEAAVESATATVLTEDDKHVVVDAAAATRSLRRGDFVRVADE